MANTTIKGPPALIAARLRRIARRFEHWVREAERESAYEALRLAREFSSGPFSTALLRKMGHPYARRKPNPPQDPAIINRQSGDFINAWRVSGPRQTTTGLKTKLINDVRYAIYLQNGTETMIERPIREKILSALAPIRRRIYQRKLKEQLLKQ
jgi:hypothetical protein